tara:strand:- start:104 stop:466 length:363 start_codon:yes stop_codon:yes gene_type:complete
MTDPYIRTKNQQWEQRGIGQKAMGGMPFIGKADKCGLVNSDMIFTHKDLKKKTKGYDTITGEIEKRGKPCEKDIFIKSPKDEPSEEENKKAKKKLEADKLQSYNKKLYKQRLSTKWDRGW